MEVSYVNAFREGDDTESDDQLMEPKPKKKRGQNRVWRLFKEFESQEEAEQYVNSKQHLICKHVLGIQIRLRLAEVPQEAKSIPMGQKRKRGRPSKAKKALLVQ